jgi:hypothetical protein
MKRLFYQTQTKLYDYTSVEECAKHIKEMENRGWKTKVQRVDEDGCSWLYFMNGQTEYPYSAEFYKGY